MEDDQRWAQVNESIAKLNIEDEVKKFIKDVEERNCDRLSSASGAIARMIFAAKAKGLKPKYYIGADQFSDSIDIFQVTFDECLSFDESYQKAFQLKTKEASVRVISLDAWEYILGL